MPKNQTGLIFHKNKTLLNPQTSNEIVKLKEFLKMKQIVEDKFKN